MNEHKYALLTIVLQTPWIYKRYFQESEGTLHLGIPGQSPSQALFTVLEGFKQ